MRHKIPDEIYWLPGGNIENIDGDVVSGAYAAEVAAQFDEAGQEEAAERLAAFEDHDKMVHLDNEAVVTIQAKRQQLEAQGISYDRVQAKLRRQFGAHALYLTSNSISRSSEK